MAERNAEPGNFHFELDEDHPTLEEGDLQDNAMAENASTVEVEARRVPATPDIDESC